MRFRMAGNFLPSVVWFPWQHSSGGKTRLSSLNKKGNRFLRMLAIHGIRVVIRCSQKRVIR